MSVFFSRFIGNESHCDSFLMNREKKIAVHAICLFRTAIHFPWTEKKDTHSLYLQCLQQRPLLKFSEQSKKFKFPAEIGHLTLFQDKTILAYSFRQNSAGSCRRFCRLCSQKDKNVQIEVQNGILSRSPQRLDPNLCQHALHLLKGKREVPRDIRNSKVRRQDKFRRDWSRH